MLVAKIYVRPCDGEAEALALGELELYMETRARLVDIENRWLRIGDQPLVEEARADAQHHRDHPPETGRKPTLRTRVRVTGRRVTVREDDPRRGEKLERAAAATRELDLTESGGIAAALIKLRRRWGSVEVIERDRQRYRVRCTEPRSPRAKETEVTEWVKASRALGDKLAELRDKWETVEILEEGVGRSDHAELQAAQKREAYHQHVDAGGYNGTYHLAAEAVSKAGKTTQFTDPLGRRQIRRRRITETSDDGRAAVALSRLTWDPDDPTALTIHGTRWTAHRRQLQLRPVTEAHRAKPGSRPRPDPTWLGCGACIVRAHLQRDRVTVATRLNVRYHWYLVLTLDCERPVAAISGERVAAGLDLSWRQSPSGGLRAAMAVLADGSQIEVTMPAELVAQAERADQYQQSADLEANRLRSMLGLPQRTSHRRLAQRALEAAPRPVHADYHGRPPESWTAAEIAHHMIHLDELAYHTRQNWIAQRNDSYREQVVRLLERVDQLRVEKMKGDPQLTEKDAGAVARDQRHRAAAFSFAFLVRQLAPRYGTTLVECDPAYTSRICHCGHDMGASSALRRTCSECGTVHHDVDVLAAHNLLHGIERPGDASPPAPARAASTVRDNGTNRGSTRSDDSTPDAPGGM